MKQSASRRFIALASMSATLLGATPPAHAQPVLDDISGPWSFKSASFDDDCTMTGTVTFAAAKTGAISCSFVIETRCTYGSGKVQEFWRVNESCTARKTGRRLQVTSRVNKVEIANYLGKPMSSAERQNYLADNFDLMLSGDAAEMVGRVFDPLRRVAMRLWRPRELVS